MIRESMKDRNILFLTSRLPYPPISGIQLRIFGILKILIKYFQVHLVSIITDDVPSEFYDWASGLGITYKIFKKRKLDNYINTLKFLFNSLPLQVNYYYFKDVQNYIDSIYKDFDLIFSILIRTSQYVMRINKPKILDIIDSIGLNYLHSQNNSTSFKWRIIYKIETKRLLEYEELCIDQFDKTLFVNEEEMNYFNKAPKTVWLPNGVKEELISYNKVNPKYKDCITFFGKMDYQPNIDAVIWFVRNVLPRLNKNLKFYILGTSPSNLIKSLENKYKNIVVTGFIEDPYEIIKSSLCNVAPMQTGGGIQNKILESMALGSINIVSSLAAVAIKGTHGKHFLVIDDPEEMAKTINTIYQHPEKFEHIKSESKTHIRNNFTWSICEDRLIKAIQEVIENFYERS
ncbi:MAG: glycosyltransferase [Thermodesulfovibrionales bacterium]